MPTIVSRTTTSGVTRAIGLTEILLAVTINRSRTQVSGIILIRTIIFGRTHRCCRTREVTIHVYSRAERRVQTIRPQATRAIRHGFSIRNL